jgi:hypothetical protein
MTRQHEKRLEQMEARLQIAEDELEINRLIRPGSPSNRVIEHGACDLSGSQGCNCRFELGHGPDMRDLRRQIDLAGARQRYQLRVVALWFGATVQLPNDLTTHRDIIEAHVDAAARLALSDQHYPTATLDRSDGRIRSRRYTTAFDCDINWGEGLAHRLGRRRSIGIAQTHEKLTCAGEPGGLFLARIDVDGEHFCTGQSSTCDGIDADASYANHRYPIPSTNLAQDLRGGVAGGNRTTYQRRLLRRQILNTEKLPRSDDNLRRKRRDVRE